MAKLNPYVNFNGNAQEAMTFYQSVLGGELTSNTFADFQMPGIAEDEADKIMHAQLETPSGFTLMASDMPSSMDLAEQSFITISLSGSEHEELQGYWDKLSEGATVHMNLEQAPWGDYFGQLQDKFGVTWLVNIAGPGSQGGEQGGDQGGEGSAPSTGTANDAAPEEI